MPRIISRYLRKRNLFKSLYYVGVLFSVSFLFLRIVKTSSGSHSYRSMGLPTELENTASDSNAGAPFEIAPPLPVMDQQPEPDNNPPQEPDNNPPQETDNNPPQEPNNNAPQEPDNNPPQEQLEAPNDVQNQPAEENPDTLPNPEPADAGAENVIEPEQQAPVEQQQIQVVDNIINDQVPEQQVEEPLNEGMADLDQQLADGQSQVSTGSGDMVIISVICMGEDAAGSLWQKRQMNVLLKTMVWMSKRHIQFHMFSDNPLFFAAAQAYMKTWPPEYQDKISFTSHDVWYPEAMKSMKMTFRPCSSQRLFLPGLLPDISKAIYLDTDLIFFRPIDELWELMEREVKDNFFGGFGPRMLEVTDKRLPYFGRREVNAGLFFMNLDKLREFPGSWEGEVEKIFFSQDMRNILGRDPDDQDILNLLTSRYIEQFYNISCEWNYRFFMCEKVEADKCGDAQLNGISILHGLGHSFFNCTKAPKFCKIFSIVENYKLTTDMKQYIYDPIQDALEKITTLYKKGYRCKKAPYFNDMVMKQFIKYIT